MTPQEFCHWLQGFFDGLSNEQELNEVQTHLMKEKLKTVVNAPQLYEWKGEAFSDQSETLERMKKHLERERVYTKQPSFSSRLKKPEPPTTPLTEVEDPYLGLR